MNSSPNNRFAFYKLLIGLLTLVCLIGLAAAIALGKVEEKTSYGLGPILALIGKVVLDFSQWAYRDPDSVRQRQDDKEEIK
jgi:hypothetical protein